MSKDLVESELLGGKLGVKGWVHEVFGPELNKTAKVLTMTGLVLLAAGTRLGRWLKS